MIIVIAGNRGEFEYFLRRQPEEIRNEFVYADYPRLLEKRYTSMLEVGTYYQRPDYYRLREEVLARIIK